MTIPKRPRIVGFDLPGEMTSTQEREPLVAVLDVEPDTAWVDAFIREFEQVKVTLGVSSASVEGRSLFFIGFTGDTRRLSVQLRALVDRANARRSSAHHAEDGDSADSRFGSVRRNN